MWAAMGRDVGLWNKRVEEYRVWLTQALESLHEEYKKQEGIFRIANIQKVEIDPDSDFYQTHIVGRQVDPNDPEQKNIPTVLAYDKVSKKLVPVERYDEMEMRRKYLYGIRIMQMLGADGYENLKKMWSAPQSVQNSYIMRSISNRATDWVGYRDETRKQNTGMLVANMVDQLRIDEEYIRRETLDLRTRELAITERLWAFSKQFQGKQQAYVLDLFRRIRAKEKMVELNLPPDVKPLRPVANGVIVHTWPGKGDIIPNRGWTRWDTKLVASMEWTWWKELLGSKEIYKPQDQGEDYSALEKIEWKNLDKAISSDALDLDKILWAFDLKIWDVFFQLLKDMVEFKRQEEFVSNIQKYGTWQKWYGPNVFDSIYK